jgi:glutathione S-transferase
MFYLDAHRAHIALEELGLPYKQEIIDLDTPRSEEYLAINPRGLIPSLSYNGEIFTESAVVSQFLADSYPGKLVPESSSPDGARMRARIQFFSDTFSTKVQPLIFQYIGAKTEKAQDAITDTVIANVVRELEPLLKDANPFFGGNNRIGLAEVLTGSFVLRLVRLSEEDVYPNRLATSLAERAPNFWAWAKATSKHPSVLCIYNEEAVISNTRERMAKARAA